MFTLIQAALSTALGLDNEIKSLEADYLVSLETLKIELRKEVQAEHRDAHLLGVVRLLQKNQLCMRKCFEHAADRVVAEPADSASEQIRKEALLKRFEAGCAWLSSFFVRHSQYFLWAFKHAVLYEPCSVKSDKILRDLVNHHKHPLNWQGPLPYIGKEPTGTTPRIIDGGHHLVENMHSQVDFVLRHVEPPVYRSAVDVQRKDLARAATVFFLLTKARGPVSARVLDTAHPSSPTTGPHHNETTAPTIHGSLLVLDRAVEAFVAAIQLGFTNGRESPVFPTIEKLVEASEHAVSISVILPLPFLTMFF